MTKMADEEVMNQEARLVQLIAQWIINDRRPPEIEKILVKGAVNWKYFNALLADHELFPFAYACLKDHFSLFPGAQVDLLKETYYSNIARVVGLQKEFFDIADIFRAQCVDMLPLKGAAFLVDTLYGEKAGLRPMVDIDILVKKEELSCAEKLVETLGYRKSLGGLKEDYWKKNSYHVALAKNRKGKKLPLLVEIHWQLDYPKGRMLFPDLWNRIRKLRVGGRDFTLLSSEDMLFCLALHGRRFGRVLSLKSVCDFARVLTQYKDLDWDYILKETRNGRLRTSLYFRLMQVNIFFDIPVPVAIMNCLRPANYKRRFIESFILKNTFSNLDRPGSNVFLKNHFLLYDDFWEPARMIINIPQEQFAKFYHLSPYSGWTLLLYWLRFLYFPYYLFVLILKATIRRIERPQATKSREVYLP